MGQIDQITDVPLRHAVVGYFKALDMDLIGFDQRSGHQVAHLFHRIGKFPLQVFVAFGSGTDTAKRMVKIIESGSVKKKAVHLLVGLLLGGSLGLAANFWGHVPAAAPAGMPPTSAMTW